MTSPQSHSLSPPSSPLSPTPSTMNSHFVQALHDYLPSSVCTDESVSCLFFKKGSIIEVFNRDDSGWWDGQCGEVRGWFPSNYVGRIGDLKRQSADFEDDSSNNELEIWHQKMKTYNSNTSTVSLEDYSTKVSVIQSRVEMARALLREDRRKSGTAFHSTNELHILIGDVTHRVAELVEACLSTHSDIQFHVCQVVSSVRSVLTEANIVNKESTLLRMYPELARQRKVVLSALSRLVLKGKELQQSNPVEEAEQDEVSFSADHLLNEMDMFEKLLLVIPRQSTSASTESTVDTTRHSSLFQFDTPRSSVSSLGHSSIMSTSSTNLRQFMTEARHSNNSSASLISKAVPISDKEHILQNILDHQASIDELMGGLVITLERYLANRHRATEMLETTRKAVEAVRTFLAVVEHVCSNLGDLDYNRRLSMIPEDPCLVSLVITKESVYSAITNLVTAVRALTGPQQNESLDSEHDVAKDDLDHLNVCCEDVVRTTNECAACVRACLETEAEEEEKSQVMHMRNMQESNHKPEISADTNNSSGSIRRSDTLSMLGRKVTTLHAIQQYKEDQQREVSLCDKVESPCEKEIEALAVQEAPKPIEINTEEPMDEGMQAADLRASVQSPTPPSPSTLTAETCNNETIENQPPAETARPVVETILSRRLLTRARSSSVNNFQMQPLLPKSHLNLKPSVSAAFPLPPNNSTPVPRDNMKSTPKEVQTLKSRRSRGLSVTSLRPSLSKSKSERISNSPSTESLHEPATTRLQKLPSWMSLGHGSDNTSRSSIENIVPTSSMSLQIPKKEPEYEFMKQYVFTEEEMIFNSEGEVTGATIEALVRKLTLHEKSPDLIFTRAFFYNFRLFTNPADFVQLLIDRFALQPPTEPAPLTDDELVLWTNRVLIPIRLRVYNVIKTWLEMHFSYEQDAYVEKALLKFASNEMIQAMPGPAKRMVELIKRTFASKGSGCAGRKHNYKEARIIMQKSTSSRIQSSTDSHGSYLFSNLTLFDDHSHSDSSEKYPPSILGKSIKNTLRKALSQTSLASIHVNDIDPVELARQLTLMENNLFCRIRPNEMIGQEFKKKLGTSQAIHVKAMIQRSTQITSWVSATILHETDTKKRAHVLKYWIKVADACLQLNNYNTPMAIRSALDSTSIARLRKTWDYVSGKYRALWEPIYRATDSQRNFAEYRQRLKATVAPCLPFLGVYLTDMTFIDDGNADRRLSPGGKPLINFDKYVKITRILNEIDQFQISYRLLEVEEIQKYLKTTLETVEQDDQVFYAMSLKREPKDEDPTDK